PDTSLPDTGLPDTGLSGAGPEFIGLGSLSGAEARTLFSRIVDDGRPEAEPEATEEVLAACAGLPLAVRVCAARLATRRRWGIGTMATRLRDERRRLDVLQLADLEVRAGFRVSYNSLKADRRRTDPARAFRLLGLWPGHRISLPAAAALTGEREADLATALGTLVDTNLLESPGPDWYRFHDLLRLFARELAQATEPWEEQQAATARLLRWYLGTALSAAECVSPHRYRMPPSEPPGPYLPLTSVETALAWYDSERASVVTACRQAAAAGLHDIAWRLPTALFPLFNRRHNWADCVTVSRIALESARAAGNRSGQAWAMNNLGVALARTGDPEGLGLAAEALALRQEIGDREGEAQSAVLLPDAYYKLRGPRAAFGHSLRCLEIMRKIGKPAVLGVGLNNHGEFCLELDRLDEAADAFAEALGILREIGAYGHGHALGNLGQVYLRSGRPDDAIAALTEAHRLHLSSGDLMGQAIALKRLGLAQDRVGQAEAARESLTSALRLFEELKEDTEAVQIRRDLGRGGRDNAASRCLPKATQCPWPGRPTGPRERCRRTGRRSRWSS
ncbi:MAG: tetratricopeptide repeat protein, partial [Nocardiopsaceae bacterium]|nr:tetratricopeptide repeat protein [Nocardiopsaceae bacterium]